MKSFPEHIAIMGLNREDTDLARDDSAFERAEPPQPKEPDPHPLTRQLQHALANPETTDVATYARLVEQILGELSLLKGAITTLEHPPEYRRRTTPARPAKLPLLDADADRIVECLANMRKALTEREH